MASDLCDLEKQRWRVEKLQRWGNGKNRERLEERIHHPRRRFLNPGSGTGLGGRKIWRVAVFSRDVDKCQCLVSCHARTCDQGYVKVLPGRWGKCVHVVRFHIRHYRQATHRHAISLSVCFVRCLLFLCPNWMDPLISAVRYLWFEVAN